MTVWSHAAKKSILSFLDYYRRFGSTFFSEFWRARGKQLSAFALVTACTIALTSPQGAVQWNKIYVVILANVLTFLIFSIWHLVRTPWLLHIEQDSSVMARTEKLALDLFRLLREQGPVPEHPPMKEDGPEWKRNWDHYWEVVRPYDTKLDALYSAHYVQKVSTIRYELTAQGIDTTELDNLIDRQCGDHETVPAIAQTLLGFAARIRMDEMIKNTTSD